MAHITQPLHAHHVSAVLTEEFSQVRSLYRNAFPAYEREPFWILYSMSFRRMAHFLVFQNSQSDFAGFAYVLDSPECTYVFYLAVNDAERSLGFGTQILEYIRQHSRSGKIALDVEPAGDHEAPNPEQRDRRMQFYARNGFVPTGYMLQEGSERYEVLSIDKDFDPPDYQKLLHKFSWHLKSPKFIKISE